MRKISQRMVNVHMQQERCASNIFQQVLQLGNVQLPSMSRQSEGGRVLEIRINPVIGWQSGHPKSYFGHTPIILLRKIVKPLLIF